MELWISGPTTLACVVASWIDLRKRVIPNWIPLGVFLWVAGLCALSWTPWASHAIGLGVGVALGLLAYATGGIGGGDVKLLFATAAAFGWERFGWFLFGVAVGGGILSFIALKRGAKDLAYGPAFALSSGALLVQDLVHVFSDRTTV